EQKTLYKFLTTISKEICDNFDWRTPSAFNPNVDGEDKIRQNQNQFKGSGGYKEMRRQLLKILSNSTSTIDGETPFTVSSIAVEVIKRLKY
ncbi:MAG TPA: hypothetical protein VN026_03460, partial [Bacteroidia bacterium]|nr:hypothetical protein [Bacteroidia bacterium]